MTKTLVPILLLLGLLAPSATAGGTLDTPVLVATVEDERGDACPLPVAGFCFFLLETDGGPTNASLEAYQRLRYVGVAVDLSLVREPMGDLWLLPDAGLTVSATDVRAPNPVTPFVTEAWRDAERPGETDRLELREDGVHLFYPRPNESAPGTVEEREYKVYWGREEGVQYDELGPFHRMAGGPAFSSDDEHDGTLRLLCDRGAPCDESLRERWAEGRDVAPSLRTGVEFYDLQAATDPSNLTPPSAAGATLAPPANATRHAFAGPAIEAAESPPRAAPRRDAPDEPEPSRPSRAAPADDPRPPPETPVKVLAQSPAQPPPQVPATLLVGATAAGLLLVALGAGLYSRFHGKGDILRSKTRDRLLDVVRQNPGVSITDAAAAMGLSRNALQHHVRMLERVQLLRVEEQMGRKALYLAGSTPAPAAPPAWLLKNPACAALVRAIQERPEGLPREATKDLLPGVPERTRNYNIQKLLAVGIVEQVVTEEGVKVLRAVTTRGPADGDASPA